MRLDHLVHLAVLVALFAGCASSKAGGDPLIIGPTPAERDAEARRRDEEAARRRAYEEEDRRRAEEARRREEERRREAAPPSRPVNPANCPHCGVVIRPADNFCESCGGRLPAADAGSGRF